MFTAVITDCSDDNARARVGVRLSSLFGSAPSITRVSDDLEGKGEIEAAGNLIDVLDAGGGTEGVVIVNTAPRRGASGESGSNGSPFCFFYYHRTLVISTIDGLTLSMVRKFELVDHVSMILLEDAVRVLYKSGAISTPPSQIVHSQFRSFDILPSAAQHLVGGNDLPSQPKNITEFETVDDIVWWIDNFGNIKTTLLAREIPHRAGETIETNVGPLGYHSTLADVPEKDTAFISGSSGIGDQRLLEIVTQGRSAAEKLGVAVGDKVLKK